MAKDPAFLFYPNDWLGGTLGMTFEEKGAYMELLMLQFNRGKLNEDIIIRVIGSLWDNIKHKFKRDDDGLYFNERLDEEQNKRKKYVDSRRKNRSSSIDTSERDSDDNKTNIYIIKDNETGNIKIGASVNPKNRLSTLKNKLKRNLSLIVYFTECTLGEEKQVHSHFKEFHISGDWFNANEEDIINHMINHMNKHMIKHMENENEDVNKDISKGINFYKSEIEKNTDKLYIDGYKLLIDYLYKSNDTGKPFTNWINLPEQLSYNQYVKLRTKDNYSQKEMVSKLEYGQNKPKSIKGNKSFYLTLNNWFNLDAKKG